MAGETEAGGSGGAAMDGGVTSERQEIICRFGNDGSATQHISPDCEVGKHRACTGMAWCFIEDAATSCTCKCHN